MNNTTQFIIVLITTPDIKTAKKISSCLLDSRIIACSNIIKAIDSIFWWKGKKETSKETLLIVKTKRSSFKKLAKLVKEAHPYDVPEIIALPIIAGHKPYLDWIHEEVD
ncbi:MAG: divalent-cation tolerance protein CutA [Candidatus Omnitrophota bacterium]